MYLKDEGVPQRRRGQALEDAILSAAWIELTEKDFSEFTIDAVAVRAATSRAVLYRRWTNKQDLAIAAIAHTAKRDLVTQAPDTGSLRGDVVALLHEINKRRVRVGIMLMAQFGGLNSHAETSLSTLYDGLWSGRGSLMTDVIARAMDRGEIGPGSVDERVLRLPIDLFRYEVLWTMHAVPEQTIEEIVDLVFLPLVIRQEA